MASSNRKRGFTLVETVVSVGIVAALAAVVYPSVVKQFDSADPTRAVEDLTNIRTGIEAFGVNVRPLQPGDLEDLVNPINTTAALGNGDSTAATALYTVADSVAWLGPYIGAAIAVDPGDNTAVITTGFGGTILNNVSLFDVDAANGGNGAALFAAADFIAIRVSGLSGAAFTAINLLIDGTLENSATLRRNSGRFRCPAAVPDDAVACTTAYFLAVPKR